MSSTITFDIEVAGFPWEEVDEITRGYLMNKGNRRVTPTPVSS